MRIRLLAWWDSPQGLLPPDEECEVDAEDGARLCASHLAEPVRERAVEVAIIAAGERAVPTRPKARRRKGSR